MERFSCLCNLCCQASHLSTYFDSIIITVIVWISIAHFYNQKNCQARDSSQHIMASTISRNCKRGGYIWWQKVKTFCNISSRKNTIPNLVHGDVCAASNIDKAVNVVSRLINTLKYLAWLLLLPVLSHFPLHMSRPKKSMRLNNICLLTNLHLTTPLFQFSATLLILYASLWFTCSISVCLHQPSPLHGKWRHLWL